MTGTPSSYNIVKSIEGNLLGLDNTKLPPFAPGGVALPIGEYGPYLTGANFQGLRIFPSNFYGLLGSDYKEGVRISHNDLFDDFLGASVNATTWNAIHGTDGTAASAVVAANNGILRLTSGANATHTMAANGAQVTGALNSLVSDGALRFEARLGNLSGAASQSICFGLVDVSTLSAPFTVAAGVVTGNGQNGAAFVQDAAGTNTALNAVAINAGGAVQVVPLTNAVGLANVFDRYRIEIDSLGNANYFIDGVLVATIALAVATTAVLAPSVGMYSEATATSKTLDIDYLLTQSLRV